MTKGLRFRLMNPNHHGMPFGPSPFAHVHFTMKKKKLFYFIWVAKVLKM
jgi:hypothetical protein